MWLRKSWLEILEAKVNLMLSRQKRLVEIMGAVEDQLQKFVDRDSTLVTALKSAHAEITRLRETDATEDQAQLDAALAGVATTIENTFNSLEAVPGSDSGAGTPEPETSPGTVETPPVPENPVAPGEQPQV